MSTKLEIREGYADVGDQILHYVEAGDGPLLVLLHGFPEFWFGWRLQIEPLAAVGFRVVAPDTRGYNLSSKPEGFEAYGVDLLADDIRRTRRTRRRRWSATSRRGRSRGIGGDGQLLPRLGQAEPEASRGKASPDRGADAGHLGGSATPTSPSLIATTCPTSTASSACPTRRIGSITTRPNVLIDFFS